MTNPLLAFHSDSAIKAKYLARVQAHAKADEIIHGAYWQNGKGCALGCTIHGDDHEAYERELGIPQSLAWLEDCIFEGLPNGDAKVFPAAFLMAIKPGANLSKVTSLFLLAVQRRNLRRMRGNKPVTDAIRLCILVLQNWSQGKLDETAARNAESAAWSARSAAWSARSAARSAAWSAAWSARSAAWSAESAARSAEYKWMGKTLLNLLRSA